MALAEDAYRTGNEISGPLFLPFVNWVLKRAADLNIEHVLFLARDGQLFHKIANEIAKPEKINTHYCFFGSRSSWYRCAPYLINKQVMSFRISTEFKNLKKTAYSLGVELNPLVNKLELDANVDLTDTQICALTNILCSQPGREWLYESTKDNRLMLMNYLNQFGISSASRIAMVDVGWNGNFQTALESILHFQKIDIYGYYYGLNSFARGSFREWFMYGPSVWANWLRFYPCLVESLTPADHASVSALQESANGVIPIFSGPVIAEPEIIRALHEGALSYVRESQNHGLHDRKILDLESVVKSPPDFMIRLFAEFYFQKPFSPQKRESFVQKHRFIEALKLSFSINRNLELWHWPQANLVVSGFAWLKYGLNQRFSVGFFINRLIKNFTKGVRYTSILIRAFVSSIGHSNKYDIVSFDIFDTLLKRECGHFLEIFETVGIKIGDSEFAELRKSTEIRLFRNKNREITIDEIYADLKLIKPSSDWEKIRDIELETEEQNLRPALRANKKLMQVRKTKAKIIFISDMYLSSDWIKQQLIKHNIWKEGDEIFVSCEVGANKRSGEIFEILLVKYSNMNWLHIGDNIISDLINPFIYGLRVKWLPYSYLLSFWNQFSNLIKRLK